MKTVETRPPAERFMAGASARVEEVLGKILDAQGPGRLKEAMEYSLFAGGKRLRPALVLAAFKACGGKGDGALKAAAALEMIHTYSLIHDDLPAMDDDDLRRGRPTNHKVFGEALAILAGDGLLTLAFETAASSAEESGLSGAETADLIRTLALGAGARGMVLGQAEDLEAENWASKNHGFNPESHLLSIHSHKTAALMTAAVEAGGVLARAEAQSRQALARYGRLIGLAFQIADDVLDAVGDKKKMGKSGSDAANKKLTYATLYGVASARRMAREKLDGALDALSVFPKEKAAALAGIAEYIVKRDK